MAANVCGRADGAVVKFDAGRHGFGIGLGRPGMVALIQIWMAWWR